MDSLDGFLELLNFEIIHNEIILIWAVIDIEQGLTVEYLN